MQLQIFKYETDEDVLDDLTTVEINEEIWFVGSEICKLLDIQNVTQALATLDEDEKLPYVLHRAGQNRQVNLISESGLYALIFKSKKPSAKQFRKWVTKEVIPSIRKKGSYGVNRLETPNFIIRFNDNWDRTDKGYFSVISELFIRLYGKFEKVGYIIPNKAFTGKEIRPDVSVGKRFSTFLKTNHPDIQDKFKKYSHKFPDGNEVEARQYENSLLPIFIKFVDEIWIPECASTYFRDRDPIALDYLPKLLN
ncbi:BRO-N domain-containing protein [Acinetobacter baumannii]|uniref:BRO-N domain-containing protein n=1 Tax=Acinetobacter baumannii TaxID=470 RepID=UPI000447962C|nr:BRO family protein [Acinetobacter baumannii]EXR48543.1 BRO family, N-terminal domain protein [Acinetobacter baumannii 1391434]